MQEGERVAYIGGTDAAAICGLSKYRSPYEVWKGKTGRSEGFPDNEVMMWGRLLEPLIAEQYIKQSGAILISANEFIQDPEYPFIAANIDRKIVEARDNEIVVLECKTVASNAYRNWKHGLPLDHYGQVQWYLGVTGFDRAVVAILIMDSRKMETFEVHRDDVFIEEMRAECIRFWEAYVIPDIEPPLTVSDYEKVEVIPSDAVVADMSDLDLVSDIKGLKGQMKALEIELEKKQELLKEKMMDKALLMTPDGGILVSWKSSKTTRVDTNMIKELYPEIAEQCSKEGISRTFLVK